MDTGASGGGVGAARPSISMDKLKKQLDTMVWCTYL